MRWITITTEDIAEYQAGNIMRALETKAKYSETQNNPVSAAISTTVDFIRSQISSGNFSLDIDKTKIPAELKNYAIALVVEYAKPRLGGALKLTEDERTLANAARAHLYKIAEGKIKPSLPDNPESSSATTQSSGGATLVKPSNRVAQRSNYSGF